MGYYLENGLKDLADKFTKDLLNELERKGHHKSGKLEKSIKFSFKQTGSGYEIVLSSLEYIQYLDNGNLLKDFLRDKQEELYKKVSIFFMKDIEKDINIQL